MAKVSVVSFICKVTERRVALGQEYHDLNTGMEGKVVGINMIDNTAKALIHLECKDDIAILHSDEFMIRSTPRDPKATIKLIKDVEDLELEGLRSKHLTDLDATISVGKYYRHYKGSTYVITEISRDSNNGYDFKKCIISYRETNCAPARTWALTVEEFLKKIDGVPRFVNIPLRGQAKRKIAHDRSLVSLWGSW